VPAGGVPEGGVPEGTLGATTTAGLLG